MTNNILKLCTDIYDISVIEYAVEKYSEIADISVNCCDKHYLCEFSNCKYDVLLSMQEFENFIIDASNFKGSGI